MIADAAVAEEGGSDDVGSLIGGFRQRRDQRERRARMGVLMLGLLVTLVAQTSAEWRGMFSAEIWGVPVWSCAYGLSNLGVILLLLPAIDLEREWGLVSPRRPTLPLLALLLYWFMQTFNWTNLVDMYGTPAYLKLAAACAVPLLGLPAVVRSRGQTFFFAERAAPAASSLHMWTRRWSMAEMFWFDFASEMVAKLLTDIFAVLGGQYDAGPLGVGGGLLVVAYGLAALCNYWRWGFAILQGTRPTPGPRLWDPASRQEMCGAFWHTGVSALGPWFMLRGFLGGYTPHPECSAPGCGMNATVMLNHVSSAALLEGKVSYSEPFGPKTQNTNLILAVVFCGIVPFWVWRRGIYGLITRPCRAKQRLADGAFIAALLLAMDDGDGDGDGGGEKHDRDLVADAAVLMRRVPMSRVTLQMLGASPRDENYDASASYSMGEACGLGGCDFFVSHSWGDDPRAKYAQLMAVTLLFQRKHGRDPTLWLDKCCTPIISLEHGPLPFI